MRKPLVTVLMPALLLALATPCLAQSAEAPPRWTFGGMVGDRDAPYRGFDEGLLAVPLIRFEGERAYLRGLRGGWRLMQTDKHELSVFGQVRLEGYKSEDSDFLEGMDDRRISLDLGLASTWTTKIGAFELAAAADALDRSGGFETFGSWTALFKTAGWTVIPSASLRWQSDDLVDYYYGVRTDEALAGRAAYRGDSAVTPEISVLVTRPLAPRWTLFARASHAWLPSEISNSPIVDADSSTGLFIGFGYSPK